MSEEQVNLMDPIIGPERSGDRRSTQSPFERDQMQVQDATAILSVFKRRNEIWDRRAEDKAFEYLNELGGHE